MLIGAYWGLSFQTQCCLMKLHMKRAASVWGLTRCWSSRMCRRAIRRQGWPGLAVNDMLSTADWFDRRRTAQVCVETSDIWCKLSVEKTCCGSVLRNRGSEKEKWVLIACQSPEHHHNNLIFLLCSSHSDAGRLQLLSAIRCVSLEGFQGCCLGMWGAVWEDLQCRCVFWLCSRCQAFSLSEPSQQIVFCESQHCGDFPQSLHWGSADPDQSV